MKNWIIRKKLGEGSFGKVYRIEREEFGEVYHAALKIITVPQNEGEIQAALEEGMSADEAEQYFYSMVEDIVREFALMAKVKGTAHVVSYEDHEVIRHTQGLGWDILIRMEELTGLLSYAYEHPFARRDIIRLGIHMCKGLELCQKYNIIHRDIKPENIFVSENGDFKLGDFGIARTVERTASGLSKKGTYNYMAPEVYKGAEYGFSVDLYSLGIVMYRLLNKNRVPFLPPAPEKLTYASREQALARRMRGEPIPQPVYARGRLWEIIQKATAYDPRDRYSSPGQMRKELEAILYEEQDATLIYPEGDEITLKENIYATSNGTVGLFHGQESQRQNDGNEKNTAKMPVVTTASGEDRTVSAFGERSEKSPAMTAGKTKKSGGKGGVIAVAAVIAIAVIGGAVMFLGGGDDGSEVDPPGVETEADGIADRYEALMKEAEELYDRDPVQALERMKEALALFPEDSGAQTDHAYGLYRCGYYSECISYIEKDLALGRNFETEKYASLMEILGAAYYEQADYAQAAVAFKSSALGGTMSESAMRDYAVCLARIGSLSEAKEVLEQLRDQGVYQDVTRYVEGELAYASGTADGFAEAEALFAQILRESGERTIKVRAFKTLANLYRDYGNNVRYGVFSPDLIADVNRKLADLLRGGIAEYNLTYDSGLYELLGVAAYNVYVEGKNAGLDQSQYHDYGTVALDAFNKVLELVGPKDYIYINRYMVWYAMDDFEAAGKELDVMETAFPKNYVPHAMRGILYIVRENQKPEGERDYALAVREYAKAGEKLADSDDRSYYDQLGSLIEQLRQGNWI